MAFWTTSSQMSAIKIMALMGLVLSCFEITSLQAQNTDVVSTSCSADQFQGQSPYASNRDNLVKKLMTDTNVGIGQWSDASDTNNDENTVYGKARCSDDVSTDSACVSCLQFISDNYFQSGQQCAVSKGAVIQLQDCYLEYEDHYITW